MEIRELTDSQLKRLYCAAVGWHSQLNEQDNYIQEFDEFHSQITHEWDENSGIIRGSLVQIEIKEDLMFRCGMKYQHSGIGGVAFDLKAVFECLKSFGCL